MSGREGFGNWDSLIQCDWTNTKCTHSGTDYGRKKAGDWKVASSEFGARCLQQLWHFSQE